MSASVWCPRCGVWAEPDETCVCDAERPAPRSIAPAEFAARFVRGLDEGRSLSDAAERARPKAEA